MLRYFHEMLSYTLLRLHVNIAAAWRRRIGVAGCQLKTAGWF